MDCLTRLMEDEGFESHAYKCPAGKWTIGYGRNIDIEGGKGITMAEAARMLASDIDECERDLRDLFGPIFWGTMGRVRQNALINMRFQMGAGGFRCFKKMIAALLERDYSRAAEEALDSRWAEQTPERAERVAEEIRSGVDLE